MHPKNEFNQTVGFFVDNWSLLESPSKTTLLPGRYCSLAPLDINKHAVPLFDVLSLDNQGESWTYLPYGPFHNREDFKIWLQQTQSEKDTLLYVILDNKMRSPIGIAGYLRITPEHGTIEIGHVHFSKLLQKTPAATEAMYLMMQYALEELHYRRCEWKCNTLNQASHNAALRLGFTFEGIFRQTHVLKNRNRDTAWFSIIDSEWPEVKEKLSAWLHPNNFDTHGNQRVRLNISRR
jgi:RimJ/RimL family protein N-acetyltransferase